VKKLLGVLIVSMFVLMSCAHKEACTSDDSACESKEEACASKGAHVCTEACDHSADKAMAQVHVCTEACDHSADAMAKEHECSEAYKAECKAVHMEKHDADHVCTEACTAECKAKAEHAEGEHAVEPEGEKDHEGGEDKD